MCKHRRTQSPLNALTSCKKVFNSVYAYFHLINIRREGAPKYEALRSKMHGAYSQMDCKLYTSEKDFSWCVCVFVGFKAHQRQ
jgi:hypothetical protein